METFAEALSKAFELLLSGNRELYEIIGLSLGVSLSATLAATLIGVPLGIYLGIKDFPFKKLLARLLYTLMGLPPVVVGLIVALVIGRKGPLGSYELMFTPMAMFIAQTLLVLPLVTGIVFNQSKKQGKKILEVGLSLGANPLDQLKLIVLEMRLAVLSGIVTGFGRAISEVGAVMMVGGNIKSHTRVMTTYIAMNNNSGHYALAIAMGLVLMAIAFLMNSILYTFVNED